MNKVYLNWEQEVFESLKKIKNDLDQNHKAKELYNGFYIWDSKFIENPEIMFIGINPGDGNPNNKKNINVKPSFQMSYLEYMDGENDTYALARDTIKAFEKAGYEKEEIRILLNERSVKTNFYYIITKNASEISKCLNALGRGKFKDFWKKSFHWTGSLIEILKPKVIICEGKGVFDELVEMIEIKNSIWKNDCGYFRYQNTTILGYERVISSMKNSDEFSKLVKEYVVKN